jgi:hypothetical protein
MRSAIEGPPAWAKAEGSRTPAVVDAVAGIAALDAGGEKRGRVCFGPSHAVRSDGSRKD